MWYNLLVDRPQRMFKGVTAMLMISLCALNNNSDQDSFEQIYENNKDLLFRYAYSILKDISSAEDAVQDAFLALAKNFEKTYEMNCNQIRSYMIIIVRNMSFKIYNKHRREVSTEDIYLDDEDTFDMQSDAENRELQKKLVTLIKELDPKYGDIIMLKYYCNMKEKDIALSLDISLENVKVRLHRAKKLLKEKLKEEGYK